MRRNHLNQIEIYFSIIQRKVLTPNEIPNLAALEKKLLDFQVYYEAIAKPSEWKFTRSDLQQRLATLSQYAPHRHAAAA